MQVKTLDSNTPNNYKAVCDSYLDVSNSFRTIGSYFPKYTAIVTCPPLVRHRLVSPDGDGIGEAAGVRGAVDNALGVDRELPSRIDGRETVDSNAGRGVDVDELALAVLGALAGRRIGL